MSVSVVNLLGEIDIAATSSDWADMIDGFQKAALQSRLGIPLLYETDAVHGNNNFYGATVFPHNVRLGATRDVDLAKRIGVATALEVRACGAQFAFAPCVALGLVVTERRRRGERATVKKWMATTYSYSQ